MNVKTVVPLSAAGVLGLVAAIVAAQLVKQRPVIVQAEGGSHQLRWTDVAVASRDLAPGTVLGLDDVAMSRFDSESAPPDAPHSAAELVSRTVVVQVPRGQVFHPSMLADKGVEGGLQAVIPTGMRAVTVEINEFTGIAGLVEPGNRVDVLARIKAGEKGGQTRTIAQNVLVLAIGQTLTNSRAVAQPGAVQAKAEEGTLPASKQQNLSHSVTLLVSPSDAERIDLAMGENPTMSMRLTLRSPIDSEPVASRGATIASLIDAAADEGARLASAKLEPTTKPAADAFAQPLPVVARRTVTVVRAGVPSVVEIDNAPKPAAAAAVKPESVPSAPSPQPVPDDAAVRMSSVGGE